MTEYIEREALLAIVEYIRTKYIESYNRRDKYNQFWADTIRYFEKKVKSAPAADVVEVRHGYWISGLDTVCSVCKIDVDVYGVERFNYCPNCGAKMDGKEVEGE